MKPKHKAFLEMLYGSQPIPKQAASLKPSDVDDMISLYQLAPDARTKAVMKQSYIDHIDRGLSRVC